MKSKVPTQFKTTDEILFLFPLIVDQKFMITNEGVRTLNGQCPICALFEYISGIKSKNKLNPLVHFTEIFGRYPNKYEKSPIITLMNAIDNVDYFQNTESNHWQDRFTNRIHQALEVV